MTALEEVELLFKAAQYEVQFRTVASRAYFAAFNMTKPLAAKQGFRSSGKAEDHMLLMSNLQKSPNKVLRDIGFKRLPRLRALRRQADYEMRLTFTKGQAEDALLDATDVADWVEAM